MPGMDAPKTCGHGEPGAYAAGAGMAVPSTVACCSVWACRGLTRHAGRRAGSSGLAAFAERRRVLTELRPR